MRKVATLAAVLLFSLPLAAGADAVISPNSPDNIVLKSSNGYDVKKEFDGTASTPDSVTYSWQWVEESKSGSGPRKNFTFSRDNPKSNTVKLIVSSTNDSDETSVVQSLRDVPNATISANSSDIDLADNQVVEFTSLVNNTFNRPDSGKVNYSWTVDGTEESTSSGFNYTFSSTGDYTVKLNASDTEDFYTVKTLTVSVSNSTSSSNNNEEEETSTSSGGGAALTEIQTTGMPVSRTITTLDPGQPEEIPIYDPNVPVGMVTLEVGSSQSDVKLEINSSSNDLGAGVAPGASVYRHLEINLNNMDASALESASIEFEVEKSWLQDRNLDAGDIVLKRYDNGWETLETSVKSEGSDSATLSAETPGFSYFAITSASATGDATGGTAEDQTEDESGQVTTQDSNFCGDGTCGSSETWESCSQDCSKPQPVIEAEELVSEATANISEGEPGYTKLQEAQAALDASKYSEAASLAREALEENRSSGSGLSALIPAILFILIVGASGAGIYYYREKILPQRNRSEELKRSTRELKQKLREQEVVTGKEEELREEIEKVGEEVAEGEYGSAAEQLEDVKEELEEE